MSKFLLSGLLKCSFIPPRDIRELRDLIRYRKEVVDQIASEKNRIIKVLENANIKLSSVLSNVDGGVGTKVINDLINGETSVDKLMCYYHGKQKVSKAEFRKALEGRIIPHHQLMLKIHKKSISDKEEYYCCLSRNQNKEACQEPVLHNKPRKQKNHIKYHLNKLKDLGIEINEIRGCFFTEAKKELENEIDSIRT